MNFKKCIHCNKNQQSKKSKKCDKCREKFENSPFRKLSVLLHLQSVNILRGPRIDFINIIRGLK